MNKIVSTGALLVITCNVLMAGGDIAPVEPIIPEVVVNDDWNYFASINVWGAGLEATTTDGSKLDVSFGDVVDNLDFGLMGTVSAKKGKWGFLADAMYVNVSKDVNIPIGDGVEITNIEMKSWVVTPMITYRVMESEQLSFDILGGARYLYLKSPIEVNNVSIGVDSDSIWDGIVGVKGKYNLNEKLFMPFYVDVGAGDSDVTWQAFAGVGYKYESFDLVAGYRYLDWDFEDSDPAAGVLTDQTMSGPMIGAMFYF